VKPDSTPVWVFEDSDEDYEITVGAMRLANLRNPIVRCANEREAESLFRRAGAFEDLQRPSLILLDLNLGGASGRGFLARFREFEWLRSVPVCILTTSSNPADIEMCYSAGGNAYLVKPVNLDRFEVMIQNLVTFWFDTAALPGREERRIAKIHS